MSPPSRFAVCNELFKGFGFDEACQAISRLGYAGIEIAPFTLAENAVLLSSDDRARIRQAIIENNLEFVGIHWLLASPAGLQAATPDAELRSRTWQFIRGLIDLCADLSTDNGGVLVFGSPKQRSAIGGLSAAEATRILTDELAAVAPHAEQRGVELLLEPLSPDQTNVVTSLEEAVRIVREIGSPAVRTMFDVHNAVKEADPHPELVRRFMPFIRHVHVNELDGREPGTGEYDFSALLTALSTGGYTRWISLEVFDFTRDPHEVAARAIQHLEQAAHSQVLTKTI